MRATLSGYYRNLQVDQNNTAKALFDVTKQISSGQKIQYAFEDTSVFVDTVRLDNEVTTLTQAKNNAENALQFSTNTDTTMNEMTKLLDSMKTDLIYAANSIHSPESLNAIALELRGLEESFVQLANTSIDGKYLFSGTDIKTKPIDANGVYLGNDGDINAVLGSGVDQKYNVSGADLFLGAENGTQREVTTNISMYDSNTGEFATVNNTLEDVTGSTADQTFYLRGTNSDGSTFKDKFTLTSGSTVNDLMNVLEGANGFTANTVNISLDKSGQIVVTDKQSGSSKLDFHLVAGNDVGAAGDLSTLVPTMDFMQSNLTSTDGTLNEAKTYDKTFFTKDGASVQSNVSQVVKSGRTDSEGNSISNQFASDSTKLHEVFAGVTYDNQGAYVSGLDGQVLNIDGTNSSTGVAYTASLNLTNGGSTFTYNGTDYNIYNVDGTQTEPEEMTYKQLMDVVNMVVTNNPPANTPGSYTEFNDAVKLADLSGTTELSYDGKITFKDLTSSSTPTQASISMYDNNAQDFSNTTGSMVTFNTNNALAISDPKTDFFKQINDLITSVELGRINADGTSGDPRNLGIENSIQVLDDLLAHLGNQHSVAGTQSQTLERTVDRTDMLIITTKTLRSETLDVDIAEASLELKQLELNYQAMLSTVSRISQLSLVNYL